MSSVRDVSSDVELDDQEENVIVAIDSEIGSVVAFVRGDAAGEQIGELLDDVGRELDREIGGRSQ